ncbi:MAG: hypothetical protein U0325_21540 [Polyangiales bacterium]
MSLWSTTEGRAAVAVGAACWVQLCVAPAATQRAPLLAVLLAGLSLVALVVGAADVARRPRVSFALATAGFFALCGAESVALGGASVPRFDAAVRIIAAFTAAGYGALALHAARAERRPLPAGITPLPAPASAPPAGPTLRVPALVCVALVALGCAVFIPARLGANALFDGARGAERLLRGRTALTAAGGLALAVMVTLSAGASALRAAPARGRRATRALTYGVWAGVAWSMRAWLDHARCGGGGAGGRRGRSSCHARRRGARAATPWARRVVGRGASPRELGLRRDDGRWIDCHAGSAR